MTTLAHAPITAPNGTTLSCKGWHQEAALRMLMNNLDPEVAEDPDKLIVYGGTGRAARSWEAFDAIVRQGIVQGTFETFSAAGERHFGGSLEGKLLVTGGLGGMGGAQPLAATMAGARCLGIDVDPARIEKRL